MRKLLACFICIALLLSGCGSSTESYIPEPTQAPVPTVSDIPEEEPIEVQTQLVAVSVPASSEIITAEEGTELFTYTSQHMQFLFPDAEIADRVILDFLNRVDSAGEDVQSVLQAAHDDYTGDTPWFPYFYQILYSPTRIDHSVLSLFGTQNSFSGGMHANISCTSANYDLLTGDVLTLGSIMHKDATTEDFIQIIIEKLKLFEEQYYLYDNYEEGVRNRLDVDENLYEDFYFSTAGLCFFFSPYEIAPYSSGVITVELPYHELTGLIYDGYFPAERDLRDGSMHIIDFSDSDMEQFDNMAEISLTQGDQTMVVYPLGTVDFVQIHLAGDNRNNPGYTVFAAGEMSDRDAIVIYLSKDELDQIQLSYTSNNETVTIPFS